MIHSTVSNLQAASSSDVSSVSSMVKRCYALAGLQGEKSHSLAKNSPSDEREASRRDYFRPKDALIQREEFIPSPFLHSI